MDTIIISQKQQKKKANEFKNKWLNRGNEKSETQAFWNSLLRDVFGVIKPEEYVEYEKPVVIDNKSFIDAYIKDTKVLIEQKSFDVDLRKAEKQSDGSYLTPYEQAKRYANDMPNKDKPDWIITCNFKEFIIYDENKVKFKRGDTREENNFLLEELDKYYYLLDFLVDTHKRDIIKETEVSKEAGLIVGKIYDSLVKQYLYINEKDENDNLTQRAIHEQQSLNRLCVRIVFCLYAEDSGLFKRKNQFHDYLEGFSVGDLRSAIKRLFDILDTPENDRDPYTSENLLEFPYVNGGLFESDNLAIPQFTDEIKDVLVNHASSEFDWSTISPTIFGAVFESTLNPETRRQGGMHYTSIENIHKVIDPLFLDDLKDELKSIKQLKQVNTIDKKVLEFQKKLASLKFLDPACGSGNFLTETFISLRKLENEALEFKEKGFMLLDLKEDNVNPIKVSINQFYGIEINDFAVTVGKTALWIAEHQMIKETENIISNLTVEFLPLHTFAKIVEGNALRMDWNDVISNEECSYIMGNPPFIGHQLRTKEQKEDMTIAFYDLTKHGKLDYVCCWYNKCMDYILNTKIHCSLVSTNSISQGESVKILWEHLFNKGLYIDFCYKSFVWNSESANSANVHCIIIGFSSYNSKNKKIIYSENEYKLVNEINGYLVEGNRMTFIENRGSEPDGMPKMTKGSQATDYGFLILEANEKKELVRKYPSTAKLIKIYKGADEFLNNKERYCLWLKDVSPSEYVNIPPIMERLKKVAEKRKESTTESVRRDSNTPYLFTQIRQPDTDYLIIPQTSSENRKYLPIGFESKDVICSNGNYLIATNDLYIFGIMMSNVHNIWMRILCGRLESRYRYSPSIYNNFPWMDVDMECKNKIIKSANDILSVREKYNDSSLSDLYNELTMPDELRKAHENNDKIVMKLYGLKNSMNDEEIFDELMKLYQEKAKNQ